VSAALGTKAAGDPGQALAEDDAGPQPPLAVVVGGGDIATGDEKKEISTAFADGLGELSSGFGVGCSREQPVEPAVEIGAVLDEGGVLEFGAAATDADSALQQLVELRGKAGVDLRIARHAADGPDGPGKVAVHVHARPVPHSDRRPRPRAWSHQGNR
jgi:hypothetical protein